MAESCTRFNAFLETAFNISSDARFFNFAPCRVASASYPNTLAALRLFQYT